ncbi:hypothetical protein [Paenibacillus ehimensis]|uniref:Uncharacterized protein n=1 Tax=Paenibacillus ehimensis TaxID=79264 RepID=A0ABT8V7X7_9BACL|nr:hypothetical protein [Paenibacillus ehimensis]MDO3676803.1 hypothetical protein [Paenibacillus ehimensis]
MKFRYSSRHPSVFDDHDSPHSYESKLEKLQSFGIYKQKAWGAGPQTAI